MRIGIVVLAAALATALSVLPARSAATPAARRPAKPKPLPTLIAVGDIHACSARAQALATAKRARAIHGIVAALGDQVDDGSLTQFTTCYAATWGSMKARTRPTPGNHEYETPGAAGYYQYFGSRAGAPSQGWYSYDYGAWHVVVLNSNCGQVGGCDVGSPQLTWLQGDLAAHRRRCTLAYFHHPLFTSALPPDGNDASPRPLWDALYAARADVVLNAHARAYERFAPQSPDGRLDRARGIREFVVGTGGGSLDYKPATFIANSRAWSATWGVLKLTLRARSYDWKFLPVLGKFTDKGSSTCH